VSESRVVPSDFLVRFTLKALRLKFTVPSKVSAPTISRAAMCVMPPCPCRCCFTDSLLGAVLTDFPKVLGAAFFPV